jgi:hypothetical protein
VSMLFGSTVQQWGTEGMSLHFPTLFIKYSLLRYASQGVG